MLLLLIVLSFVDFIIDIFILKGFYSVGYNNWFVLGLIFFMLFCFVFFFIFCGIIFFERREMNDFFGL